MIKILFLFSPILFSGLFLLVGETINWILKGRNGHVSEGTATLIRSGRK
jgi:hypothetical protein